MKTLPITEDTPVVRTDFSYELAWEQLCGAASKPVGSFRAYIEFISDQEFEGKAPVELLQGLPPDFQHTFLLIADTFSMTHPEHPLLAMDLYAEPGRTFRFVPSETWAVQNNLSLANMDFIEFADAVDNDGIFRGFPQI